MLTGFFSNTQTLKVYLKDGRMIELVPVSDTEVDMFVFAGNTEYQRRMKTEEAIVEVYDRLRQAGQIS